MPAGMPQTFNCISVVKIRDFGASDIHKINSKRSKAGSLEGAANPFPKLSASRAKPWWESPCHKGYRKNAWVSMLWWHARMRMRRTIIDFLVNMPNRIYWETTVIICRIYYKLLWATSITLNFSANKTISRKRVFCFVLQMYLMSVIIQKVVHIYITIVNLKRPPKKCSTIIENCQLLKWKSQSGNE